MLLELPRNIVIKIIGEINNSDSYKNLRISCKSLYELMQKLKLYNKKGFKGLLRCLNFFPIVFPWAYPLNLPKYPQILPKPCSKSSPKIWSKIYLVCLALLKGVDSGE